MSNKILLGISDNEGYSPDQVNGMSLADLLEQVQYAIDEFGEDAEVVLSNGQRYGAGFGRIATGGGGDSIFYSADEDEEDTF